MRPTRLTPEVQAKICLAIEMGNSRKVSAEYAGITERTLYNWLNKGRDAGEGKFFQFFQCFTRAEAECVVWHVANIKKQAKDDWRASLEWLKRRRPKDWSEKHVVSQVSLSIDFEKLTDDQLLRIQRGEPVENVLSNSVWD